MDLKKIQGIDGIISTPTTRPAGQVGGMGPSFKETLNKVSTGGLPPAAMNPGLPKTAASEGVKFSNHAIERMQSRGITYGPDDIARLNQAVAKAAAKGSKDSLVLMNDSALIVSVKNNTVVTVMDKNALKENVFTNIDSTVVL